MDKQIAVATRKCPTCQQLPGRLCKPINRTTGRITRLSISATHITRTK